MPKVASMKSTKPRGPSRKLQPNETGVRTRHATGLIREERPAGGPFIVREFIPHDSRLQFETLNHGQYKAINSGPACRKSPRQRTCRGHRISVAVDLERTSYRQGTSAPDQY